MSNKYFLKVNAPGQVPELEIEGVRFEKLKNCRPVLTHALAIEEKYSIIISNFLELEREATNASISSMIQNNIEYKDFFNIRLTLNTCLVNLLTSVRLYTDQLSSHICACLPNKHDIKSKIKRAFSAEYDSRFEFRFMEALRNHVQHSGIPVHLVSTKREWTSFEENGLLEFSLYFAAQRNELASDNGFKKQVLEEMPEQVDLKLASRIYIEAISSIHTHVRALIETEVEESRLLLDKAIQDYMVVYDREPLGLSAYEFQGEEKTDEILILTKWDDIRRELIKRNGKLTNLGKRYVSSKVHNK